MIYGGGDKGTLDLSYTAANADVQADDLLVTSGIDGTYPPGLPVAKVTKIERDAAYSFAKITCIPPAGPDQNRQVLVLSREAGPAGPAGRSRAQGGGERTEAEAPQEARMSAARASGLFRTARSASSCRSTWATWCSRSCSRMLFNLMPWNDLVGVPDMVALVLACWCVHQPRKMGIGAAWFVGLVHGRGQRRASRAARFRLRLPRLRRDHLPPAHPVVHPVAAGGAHRWCCCSRARV